MFYGAGLSVSCEECQFRGKCVEWESFRNENVIPIIFKRSGGEEIHGFLSEHEGKINMYLFGEACGLYLDRDIKVWRDRYRKCDEDCSCCKHRFLCYTVRRR